MFCIHCGKQIPEGSRFCIHCGTPVGAAPSSQQPSPLPSPAPAKPKFPIAVIACILLGVLTAVGIAGMISDESNRDAPARSAETIHEEPATEAIQLRKVPPTEQTNTALSTESQVPALAAKFGISEQHYIPSRTDDDYNYWVAYLLDKTDEDIPFVEICSVMYCSGTGSVDYIYIDDFYFCDGMDKATAYQFSFDLNDLLKETYTADSFWTMAVYDNERNYVNASITANLYTEAERQALVEAGYLGSADPLPYAELDAVLLKKGYVK